MNIFTGLKDWFTSWKDKTQIYGGGVYSFGSKTEINKIYSVKQDNDLLIDYFNNIAEVAAPVLKYSDGAKQVKLIANIPEVQELINKPNQYHGGDEFFSLCILYKRLFGEAIINAFSTINIDGLKKPKKLFFFSPQYTTIETSKTNDFRLKEILYYHFPKSETDKISVEPENILHIKEISPNFADEQYLFGESRYAGCASCIQSIQGGYDTKVNLYDDGPALIITGKGQNAFAAENGGDNIHNVQAAMKKYGQKKGKYRNLVTDVPLDVFKASMNVKELQLNENNQADFRRLCDAQGLDVKVFSEASKFDDKKLALTDFYNNSFRSEIDGTIRDLEKFLQTWWPNLELTPDYSEIVEVVEAKNKENKRLFEDVKMGLITRNEYLEKTKQPTSIEPTFNNLYVLTNTNEWRPINEINEEANTETKTE